MTGSAIPRWPRSIPPFLATLAMTVGLLVDPSFVLARGGGSAPAAPASIQSTDGTWSYLKPLRRSDHGAIYDPVRDRVILFGGDLEGPRNDVWVLDRAGAATWTRLEVAGTPPTPRYRATVAYDPVRDRVLVFGGFTDDPRLNDVWALSLAGTPTWTQLTTAGTPPLPRGEAAGVYDPVRDRLLIHGGNNDAALADSLTYELTLAGTPTWSTLATTGPAPLRAGETLVYDPSRDRLVAFAGYSAPPSKRYNAVWALPLSGAPLAWTQLAPTGTLPATRMFSSAVYDPAGDRMLVFGGYVAGLNADLWQLTFAGTPAWTKLTPAGAVPSARSNHQAIYDPSRQEMVLVSGIDSGDENWSLALSGPAAWNRIPTDDARPTSPADVSMVVDAARHRAITFGGYTNHGAVNDTWALPLGTDGPWASMTTAGTTPAARQDHSAIYDPVRDRMIVYGGSQTFGPVLGDLQALALSGTPTWSALSASGGGPGARTHHQAVYDATGDRMLLFGGADAGASYSDLWSLDLAGATPAWTLLAASGSGPAARTEATVVLDDARHRLLVYGGLAPGPGTPTFDDLWAYDLTGGGWSLLAPGGTLPIHRHGATGVIDAGRDRLLVYAGVTEEAPFPRTNELWALDLATTTWSLLAPGGDVLDARLGHAALWDAAGDRMIVYGGLPANYGALIGDTWVLSFDPPASTPAARITRLELSAPRPNPARGAASFALRLPAASSVRVAVLDLSGRVVRVLADGSRPAGEQTLRWDLRDARGGRAAPGMYFLDARVGSARAMRRLVVLD